MYLDKLGKKKKRRYLTGEAKLKKKKNLISLKYE